MSYIIQSPNSLTNPTNDYRVVDYDEWIALPINPPFDTLKSKFTSKTYEEANRVRNEWNNIPF